MFFDFEVVVGTNEEYVIGYEISCFEDQKAEFKVLFANHCHMGRVKQVAINKEFLVSGGTDEFIRIFNLKLKEEVGSLTPHNGTITCLKFHQSGVLFSGSEDGRINIFKTGKSWEIVKELKRHSRGVRDIAVHPSGKLALSVTSDNKLMTWDLVRGKRVYIASIKKAADVLSWSPSGSHYLIASQNILDIYDVATSEISHSIDFGENIHCLCFITEDLLVIGGEKPTLSLFSISLSKELCSWSGHEKRTKCLAVPTKKKTGLLAASKNDEFKSIVCSGSSDGLVKVWLFDNNMTETPPKLIGEYQTRCRITCMATRVSENKQKFSEKIKQAKLAKEKKENKRKKSEVNRLKKEITKFKRSKVIVVEGSDSEVSDVENYNKTNNFNKINRNTVLVKKNKSTKLKAIKNKNKLNKISENKPKSNSMFKNKIKDDNKLEKKNKIKSSKNIKSIRKNKILKSKSKNRKPLKNVTQI